MHCIERTYTALALVHGKLQYCMLLQNMLTSPACLLAGI